jgi:hypothetical protein
VDIGIRILEVEGEMLSQRLHGRLARVVRRVAGRIRDALLATCDDDRGRCVGGARLERRDICVQPVDYAKEVRVEYLRGVESVQDL